MDSISIEKLLQDYNNLLITHKDEVELIKKLNELYKGIETKLDTLQKEYEDLLGIVIDKESEG